MWEGFRKAGIWGTIQHLLADFFPSAEVRKEARENIRGTVERWKQMHDKPAEPAEHKPAPEGG